MKEHTILITVVLITALTLGCLGGSDTDQTGASTQKNPTTTIAPPTTQQMVVTTTIIPDELAELEEPELVEDIEFEQMEADLDSLLAELEGI